MKSSAEPCCCILRNMTDRYGEEALRLAGLLKTLAKTQRRSIRSLEQQMGVGTSIFHKVLKGEVTLQVRHLLMIADALEIGWAEFFHLAYPRSGAAAVSEDSLLGDLNRALGEPAVKAETSDAEFEERVKRVLVHLGLLPEEGEEDFEEPRMRSA
jgi:transcriptional regulator with XRE-family HTH domain